MESEKDRYYRAKNQELNRIKYRESNAELVTLLLFIAGAALAAFASLIIISPGVLSVAAATYYLSLQPSWITAWSAGLAISLLLLTGIYFSIKNKIKTGLIYTTLVILSSITIYYYPISNSQTLLNLSLNIYLPILNSNNTEILELEKEMDYKSDDSNLSKSHAELTQPAEASVEPSSEINNSNTSEIEIEPAEELVHSPASSQTIIISDNESVTQPSFDCSLANHRFEILVCENYELSALDVQLNSLYADTRSQLSPEGKKILLEQQRDWIKQSRLCSTTTCVSNAYQMRIEQISAFQFR